MGPFSRDQQVGVRIAPEDGDDLVETFDLLEATDEQKIGPPVGRGGRRGSARLGVGEKVRQHVHVRGEPELAVLLAAELTHRDERIYVA